MGVLEVIIFLINFVFGSFGRAISWFIQLGVLEVIIFLINFVFGSFGGTISWLIQLITEKFVSSKLDEIRSRVSLEDHIKSLKSQIRKAHLVLGHAETKQIMNEYLKTLLCDFRELVFDSEKLLNELGHCCCVNSSRDSHSLEIGGVRRTLQGDNPSNNIQKLVDELKEIGDDLQAALLLEQSSNNVRSADQGLNISTRADDAEILERLQLPSNIEHLKIIGYNGSIPPARLDRKLLGLINLEIIYLGNCMNLKVLPPLGQLPRLRQLYLENLPEIKEVKSEFYGHGSIMGFPSLEELAFHFMPQCEMWVGMDNCLIFPRLKKLTLTSCCKLKKLPCRSGSCSGNHNCCLPRLRELFVYDCPQLILPSFPFAHVLSELS